MSGNDPLKDIMKLGVSQLSSECIQAVGVIIYSIETNQWLFVQRADPKTAGLWGIPGGKIKNNETFNEAITRECFEELGIIIDLSITIPIQKYVNNSFSYHTFLVIIEKPFLPKLNNEHLGFAWMNYGYYPKPLHPGVFETITSDFVREKMESIIE